MTPQTSLPWCLSRVLHFWCNWEAGIVAKLPLGTCILRIRMKHPPSLSSLCRANVNRLGCLYSFGVSIEVCWRHRTAHLCCFCLTKSETCLLWIWRLRSQRKTSNEHFFSDCLHWSQSTFWRHMIQLESFTAFRDWQPLQQMLPHFIQNLVLNNCSLRYSKQNSELLVDLCFCDHKTRQNASSHNREFKPRWNSPWLKLSPKEDTRYGGLQVPVRRVCR